MHPSTLCQFRPEVAAFRLARFHFHTLHNLSTELSALAAILLTISDAGHNQQLTNFPHSAWPTFSLDPQSTAAAMRKHNIPADASLPPAEAEAMFIVVRNLAFQLLPAWRVALLDMRVLAPMATWLPDSWTKVYWRPQAQCRDSLARWGDIVPREEELEQLRRLGTVVTSRAGRMVRGARVHAEEDIYGGCELLDRGGLLGITVEVNGY